MGSSLVFMGMNCSTYVLPTVYHYENWYPNPVRICADIVTIVMVGLAGKLFPSKISCYQVYSSAIELSQTNGDLENVAV